MADVHVCSHGQTYPCSVCGGEDFAARFMQELNNKVALLTPTSEPEILIEHEVATLKRQMQYLLARHEAMALLSPWMVLRLIATIEGRPKISPLGYEHAITSGWNEHNARRHELIEAKRSRSLSESESTELAELQWLAGIKRELQTGPIQTDHNSPERIRVIVRPGKDDWIGVACSSSVEPNDVIREYVRRGFEGHESTGEGVRR